MSGNEDKILGCAVFQIQYGGSNGEKLFPSGHEVFLCFTEGLWEEQYRKYVVFNLGLYVFVLGLFLFL